MDSAKVKQSKLNSYLNSSNSWDTSSSVRSKSETYDLILDDSTSQNWHLPNYSGILQHKAFSEITETDKRFVMGTQLLEFVTKQARFEIDCVNVVASNLALNKYPFEISSDLKLDAFKIYTDEGYHAYFTQKVANQIRDFYGIDEIDLTKYIDNFFIKVQKIGSKVEAKHQYLSMLALVIVGENQIVSDITNEMKKIVYEPIRVLFRDHAIDEAFHAKFFSILLELILPQLSASEKEILGFNICESMILLGTPRTDIYFYSLAKLGYSKELISNCISEIYDTKEWKTVRIKERMTPTISLLDKCGIFEIDKVRNKFQNMGLI